MMKMQISTRLFFLIFASVIFSGCSTNEKNSQRESIESNTSQSPKPTLTKKKNQQKYKTEKPPWKTIYTWKSDLSNGKGKIILVPHSYNSKEGMKKLGLKINNDPDTKNFIIINIYDNLKAAEMFKITDKSNFSYKDSFFFQKHLVGEFFNNSQGRWLEVWPEGFDQGDSYSIHYKQN